MAKSMSDGIFAVKLKLRQVHSLDDKLSDQLERLVGAIESWAGSSSRLATVGEKLVRLLGQTIIIIAGPFRLPGITPIGDDMASYLVPNNQPDNPYTLPTVTVKDQEGEVITSEVTETFESTDPEVISIINNGDVHDPAGTVHFGRSGVANLNHVVSHRGEPIHSASINITITQSSAATVDTSGEFGLPGITPVEEPGPPPAPEPTPEPTPEPIV